MASSVSRVVVYPVYFVDALSVLARRWYIVLLGLTLIGGAAAAATQVVPANYQASGQVLLLLPSTATGRSTPSNPYLNLQDGLTLAASLIASNLLTPDVQRDMAGAGFKANYAIAVNPGTGPLLVISTEDTDPHSVLTTRDEVIRRVNRELSLIQAGEDVPENQLIGARPFSVTSEAERLSGSKVRAIGVIGAVGIVLTAIGTFVLDRWLPRKGIASSKPPATFGKHGLAAGPVPARSPHDSEAETRRDPVPSGPGTRGT